MMSADPFIQAPGSLQSYNRYSYVMNNPLNLTDPSGYRSIFQKLMHLGDRISSIGVSLGSPKLYHASVNFLSGSGGYQLKSAALGYVSLYCGAWVAACNGGFQAALAKGYGASDGDAFRAGAVGAISSAAFQWAGNQGGQYSFERYLAHAGAGCVSAAAGGGNCGRGAVAGVFGKFASNELSIGGSGMQYDIANGFIAATAGGIGSVIAGGKFENGAVTAAYGYLFNHLSHWAELAAHGREAHTLLQNEMAQNGYTVESKCAGTNCVSGRFDIADANTAEVWEIKRNSIFGHLMGQFSLDAYTDNTGLSRGGNLVGMRVGGSMTLMTNQATYTYTNFGGGLIGYTRDSIATPSKLPAPGPFMLPGRGGRLSPR